MWERERRLKTDEKVEMVDWRQMESWNERRIRSLRGIEWTQQRVALFHFFLHKPYHFSMKKCRTKHTGLPSPTFIKHN